MGWENRGTQKYYYRSERIAGQVRKKYLGRGPTAELFAEGDQVRRKSRQAQGEVERSHRASFDKAAKSLEELDQVGELLLSATLLLAGYHRHGRGAWRKRHGSKQRS